MLSSTFEMFFMVASNSHIIFCFCNFIIAILLVGGLQPSNSEDTSTTTFELDMSKRRETLGTKPSRFRKGMNFDSCEVRKMDTTAVTSHEMHTISVLSDRSTVEVLGDINQDNITSGTYKDVARVQYENEEGDSPCISKSDAYTLPIECCDTMLQGMSASRSKKGTKIIDRTMHLANTRKETDDAIKFEKSDEKEDDELRRRIEDFIEKINRGWRAEKLGICYQSQ